jgi:hypothetical protein
VREGTGVSLGISAVIVSFGVFLASILVVTLYVAISIYAIVVWIANASNHPNPVVILLLVVGSVGLWVSLLGTGIHFLGRSMTPKRRT